jgi:hypothetical protein
MSWNLLQSEKAFNTQVGNCYILVNTDKNYKTNKIELAKVLKKLGLTATKVNSTGSNQKIKTKGMKKKKVTLFRPKKWYITLQNGQTLSEEKVLQLNQ